ncbi:MAG: glycosyltransferase [Candidatus Pacebacteria bacterium]|nr:glycosyltransferase [Candidatus Paceibacterota bacterium]
MKIITLVPVKNEGWILRFSLKNFSLFSDEIIILDDHSTDDLLEIAQEYPKVRVVPFETTERHVDMSLRRNILLQEGRRSNGTHFVFLDADETFSGEFSKKLKETVSSMDKGATLFLPWVLIRQDNGELCFNSTDRSIYKDFIFSDDGTSTYKKQFLSEERTPGDHTLKTYHSFETGYVLHFQKIAQKRNQLKQAWYRCSELVEGSRSARRINATYRHSKESVARNKELLKDEFTLSNFKDIRTDADYDFYIQQISTLFEQKNIVFFESLDIWDIPELREMFVRKVGRGPEARVFPDWLLFLNDLKNKVKNSIIQ